MKASALYKQLEDNDLIYKYLESQNQLYFSELYGRYADKIYGKCLSILRDAGLAEDAAQEVFMKIFLRLSTFDGKSKFSTWVYSITYNYCIDLIRKQKRSQNIISTDDEHAPQVAGDEHADGMSDAEFLELDLKKLGKALNQIPADDKAVLILKYQDGASIKDLAEITGKTESAVKMKLKRAKEKVRDKYDKLLILLVVMLALWMKK